MGTEEMLAAMVKELSRLITKYSDPYWYNTKQTARDLVTLLTQHLFLVQTELNDVRAGRRLGDGNPVGWENLKEKPIYLTNEELMPRPVDIPQDRRLRHGKF